MELIHIPNLQYHIFVYKSLLCLQLTFQYNGYIFVIDDLYGNFNVYHTVFFCLFFASFFPFMYTDAELRMLFYVNNIP